MSLFHWAVGYCLPGIGLIGLGFLTAAVAPADVIGLGGFLCFFTVGVSLIIEGSKRRFRGSQPLKRKIEDNDDK